MNILEGVPITTMKRSPTIEKMDEIIQKGVLFKEYTEVYRYFSFISLIYLIFVFFTFNFVKICIAREKVKEFKDRESKNGGNNIEYSVPKEQKITKSDDDLVLSESKKIL